MENNKLIAEFMELPIGHMEVVKEPFIYEHNGVWFCESELLYHTSWDWLMPVVSKITRDEQYIDNDYREHLMDIVPYGHIEDTYDAVVGFINEYNKTNRYD